MARALIVACGCRGRALGTLLSAEGWQVRGTSRTAENTAAIEQAGIEAAIADPDRPGTILDLVGDVTVLHWLLGSLHASPAEQSAIHGPRLERLLEKLVDTPVRGFVYEAAGGPAEPLSRGAEVVRAATATWRIPAEIVNADPADHPAWLAQMAAATKRLVS